MGTNYYFKKNYCDACGRGETEHIGKSSAGWQFVFQMPEGKRIESIAEMKDYLIGKVIFNEYGEQIPHSEFWKMVENKQGQKRNEYKLVDVSGYDFCESEFS